MLTTIYPPWLVDESITAAGRLEQRQRMLPARVVLYHLLAMALYEEASYEEVMRRLLEGLAWQSRWPTRLQLPTKAAIFKARTRLGTEPLAELFSRSVQPLARAGAPEATYRDRPVVAIDHHSFPLVGTSTRAQASSVQPASTLDVVALVEGRTHVVLDMTFDDEPRSGARALVERLRPGALYAAAPDLASGSLCQAVRERDADLIFDAESSWRINPISDLADGSQLVDVHDSDDVSSSAERLRMINPTQAQAHTLLTTLVDPVAAPAEEIRTLYSERASVAACIDDLRVHQNASAIVLRSKSADGAVQELYGLLLAHYAIRALLTDIDLAPIPASPQRPQAQAPQSQPRSG